MTYRTAMARSARRRGIAYVWALLFLMIVGSLAATVLSTVDLTVQKARNAIEVSEARMAAESGLSYIRHNMRYMAVPGDTTTDTMLSEMQKILDPKLRAATSDANGACLSGGKLMVPEIQLAHGSFTGEFTTTSGGCLLTVEGSSASGAVSRRVTIEFTLEDQRSAIFDYTIASKGHINLDSSAKIYGSISQDDADILSVRGDPPAITIGGSADLGGEAYVSGDDPNDGYISYKGGGFTVATIKGSSAVASAGVLHYDTPPPPFPEVNTAMFESYVSVPDDLDDLESKTTLTNVRIPANTNPDFSSNVTLKGVIYVEYPNDIKFSGGASVEGVIVTGEPDDPNTAPDYEAAKLTFTGNFSLPGIKALESSDPELYQQLKQFEGSVLLAPNFSVEMTGSSEAVNGVIAADKFYFTGSTDIMGDAAPLTGTIIGLKDEEMYVSGSTDIRMSPMPADMLPPGFDHSKAVNVSAGSYQELKD